MNRIANEEGMHPRVLLEVNVAGEGSKFGFQPETVRAEMESLLALPRLSIEGLMCIPPLAEEAEGVAEIFCAVARAPRRLEKEFDLKLPQLSMGMTQRFSGRGRGRRDAGACGDGDFWRALEKTETESHR